MANSDIHHRHRLEFDLPFARPRPKRRRDSPCRGAILVHEPTSAAHFPIHTRNAGQKQSMQPNGRPRAKLHHEQNQKDQLQPKPIEQLDRSSRRTTAQLFKRARARTHRIRGPIQQTSRANQTAAQRQRHTPANQQKKRLQSAPALHDLLHRLHIHSAQQLQEVFEQW